MAAAEPAAPASGGAFLHRCYNGWITDLATEPDPHAARPSMRLDERMLQEFFFHILANPSSEITFQVADRALAAPTAPLEKLLADAVEELYQPRDAATGEALAKFFLDAEEAYFRHQPGVHCGTISLEPLVSDKPGPPVYLRDRLKPPQREAYGRDLERLAGEFEKLRGQVRSVPRVERVAACLQRVQDDVQASLTK